MELPGAAAQSLWQSLGCTAEVLQMCLHRDNAAIAIQDWNISAMDAEH